MEMTSSLMTFDLNRFYCWPSNSLRLADTKREKAIYIQVCCIDFEVRPQKKKRKQKNLEVVLTSYTYELLIYCYASTFFILLY